MSKFILAIDQGTTGTTSLIINADTFDVIAKKNQEFPQIFPQPSWVEHNLGDIWQTVEATTLEAMKLANITAEQIACIGITNQRETTCAFDRQGNQLHNAIVWQDRRTNEYCENLKSKHEERVKSISGLPIDPYFSGSKMRWLLTNSEKVSRAKKEENLFFGNIDTFLLYRLTGGQSYATDFTNASRTLLMDLEKGQWSDELLELFDIDKKCLPEIKDSVGNFGQTQGLSFLPDGIPITGILGDQQAALFGQAGFEKGDMKNTYGTGAFFLINTGEQITRSQNGLMSTAAFSYQGKKHFALEGGCYIAGAAVQWLRDNLGIIESSPEIEDLATKITDLVQMKNIQFLPFFSGLGAPYWKPDALGAIVGITRDTDKNHLALACLEGIAQSVADLVESTKEDFPQMQNELRVDGGAAANNLLLQLQSNFLNMTVVRPQVIETTAAGVAFAAAIGADLCDFQRVKEKWKVDRQFSNESQSYFDEKRGLWHQNLKQLYRLN